MHQIVARVFDYFNVGQRDWAVRRRLCVCITLFACFIIWRCTTDAVTDKVFAAATISQMVIVISAVIAAYIAGATAETIKTKNATPPPAPEIGVGPVAQGSRISGVE
jgi:NAD/NADP transhydrogenase alpha subunit